MKVKEVELLEKYLKNSSFYFEFGSGNSTSLAIKLKVAKIVSIESDLSYVIKGKENDPERKASINYIDIQGDRNSWGAPKDESKNYNWGSYYKSIRNMLSPPDLVLIDGRFRVMCALETYKKCDANSYVLIHDYTDRPHYNIIEKLFDKVECKETLQVFKKKRNVDQKILKDIESKYKNNFN